MPSSTSSSEAVLAFEGRPAAGEGAAREDARPERVNHLPPQDPRRVRARRRMALKTIAFGGSLLLVALLAVRGIVDAIEQRYFNAFSVLRIQDAARHLDAALQDASSPSSAATVAVAATGAGIAPSPAAMPFPTPATAYGHGAPALAAVPPPAAAVPAPHRTVYLFGSSLVEFGFSPDIFDAAMRDQGLDVRSYNFAYGNADPGIHHLFARKFARTFAGQPHKVDLVVFEFTPFQATRRREQQTGQLDSAVQSMLYDWPDFLALARQDHEKAVSLLSTRLLRNGVPAEAITNLLATLTRSAISPSASVDDGHKAPLREQGLALYHRLLAEWPQASPPGGWYRENRGGLPATASAGSLALADDVMARLQVPARMQASRRQRLGCCDIEDLDISAHMLDEFIAAVKEAQKASDRVDVLLMPRNQDVVHLSAAGRANLARALARIRAETGARVVDFSERPYYGVQEFLDADHLTLFRGRARLTRQLADFYAADPLLKPAAGNRPAVVASAKGP